MKAEYLDDKDTKNKSGSMFSKFHPQPQKFHPPPPPIHHPNPQYHHHFHLGGKESQTSEEADSAAAAAVTTTIAAVAPPAKKLKTAANEDGATIEVVRRPRGRPPGSKNKPKPPIVITRQPDPVMSSYILEVQGGVDIVETLTCFTQRRNVGLCLLTASGTVANVSLKQPSTTTPGGTVTFHGRFDILSLSAVLFGGGGGAGGGGGFGFSGYGGNGLFSISLAGPQGQIVGGKVVGPLLAAGTVYVIAASFNNPSFYRLPIDSEDVHHHSVSGGSGGGDGKAKSPGNSGGGGSGDGDVGGEGGGGGGVGGETIGSLSMYGCHLGSDVLWAPTARPTPHHPF